MALTKVQIDGVEFSDSTDLNVDNGTLVVDSTNNRVGVGTASPVRDLHVHGTNTDSELVLTNSTTTAAAGNGLMLQQDGNDTYIWNKENSFMSFGTNANEKLRIDSSGRVGIGVTPAAWDTDDGLEAIQLNSYGALWNYYNNVQLGFNVYQSSTGDKYLTADEAAKYALDSGGNHIWYNASSGSANGGITWNERLRIDSSGRLLVGTSTARSNFFNSSISAAFQVEGASSAGDPASRFIAHTYGRNNADDPIYIFAKHRGTTVGDNTIVSDGDFLGLICFQGSDGSQFVEAAQIRVAVDGTPGANDMPGRLSFLTTPDGASSASERMRINKAGDTGIAVGLTVGSTTPLVSSRFCLSASVVFSGAGNSTLKYNTSSGEVTYDTSSRLVKDNIVDCPYGINELKLLQPRKYFRTDDQREEIGFVADELVQVMPEFVPVGAKAVITKNEEDTEQIPLGVSYEKLTAVLTKALQEAIGEIESLKARVAALEAN